MIMNLVARVVTYWKAGVFILALTMANNVNATLIEIGTATISAPPSNVLVRAGTYNLIYDDDSPLGPITWLDILPISFTRGEYLMGWHPSITALNLNPGVTVHWNGNWRLTSAGNNPQAGYNQTTSEIGHLYYTELHNSAGSGWVNTGDFQSNLSEFLWTGSTLRTDPWNFYNWTFNSSGYQSLGGHSSWYSYNTGYGIYVIDGLVTAPVPEPATMLLFSIGIAGLAVTRFRSKK